MILVDYAIDLMLIIAIITLSVWAIITQRRLDKLTQKPHHDTLDRGLLTLVDCPACHQAVIGRKRLDCGDLNRPPWSHPVLTQVTFCTVCGTQISERNLGDRPGEVALDRALDDVSQSHS